jgi:putative oxidoreductase
VDQVFFSYDVIQVVALFEQVDCNLNPMSEIRILIVRLHAWVWIGILLARVTVGFAFLLSGAGKLFVSARREQMRQTLRDARIPFPQFNALFVSAVEFVFGLLLIAGLATPLACVMLASVMTMAILTIAVRKIEASSALGWLSEFLYLPEVLYLVILVWLFFSGAGWFSVDQLLLLKTRF